MSVLELRPIAVGDYDNWVLGAGGSKVAAVDPGDPFGDDGLASYIKIDSESVSVPQSFKVAAPGVSVVGVNSVNYYVICLLNWTTFEDQNFVFARLNGVDGTPISLDQEVDNDWTIFAGALPRPGGGLWTPPDLYNNTLQIVIANPDLQPGENAKCTSMGIRADVVEGPKQISQAMDTLSRHLWMFLGEIPILNAPAPLKAMDLELYDEVALSDYGLPLQHALGDRSDVWARPVFRVGREETNLDLDPGSAPVKLTLKDIRHELVTFVDMGRSFAGGRPLDGVLRFDVGCARQWSRNSKAWVEDPADGLIRERQGGEEKIGPEGMIFERASTNGFTRSSFISQLTGWTTTTGVTAEPAAANQPRFETGVTGWVAKIVSNAVADRGPTSPASISYSGNTRISISLDYREGEADTGLKVRITRSVDGWYWNGTTWQAGAFDLTVPASMVNARALFEDIDVGVSATTVQARAVIPMVAGKTAFVTHVQVEAQRWASATRIVTDTATVTRVIDDLTISNESPKFCWNNPRGSGLAKYVRKWGNADTTELFYFFDVRYRASDRFSLFYRKSTQELVFKAERTGSPPASATVSWVPTRDVAERIGWRWVSNEGELGLAPYTLSVFALGQKGTDATAADGLPEELDTDMHVGVDNTGANSADGVLSEIVLSQLVYTDSEMARGGP